MSTETQHTLTAEDFGPSRYGVHLYSTEDDWGWYVFGHPNLRPLLAAINHESREIGVDKDLHEHLDRLDIIAGIRERWAHNVRINEWGEVNWDWCQRGAPGAVAVTVVNP